MVNTLAGLVRSEVRSMNRQQVTAFRKELERRLPDFIRAAGDAARHYQKGSDVDESSVDKTTYK